MDPRNTRSRWLLSALILAFPTYELPSDIKFRTHLMASSYISVTVTEIDLRPSHRAHRSLAESTRTTKTRQSQSEPVKT